MTTGVHPPVSTLEIDREHPVQVVLEQRAELFGGARQGTFGGHGDRGLGLPVAAPGVDRQQQQGNGERQEHLVQLPVAMGIHRPVHPLGEVHAGRARVEDGRE